MAGEELLISEVRKALAYTCLAVCTILGHHQPVQLLPTVLRHRFRIVRRSVNGYLGHINILFAEANRKTPQA